ncbi:MAG: redox-regulated ATPase YchF [Desulfatiglandales bacterium]
MKIGLMGLQNSGKTTIFNALTRSEAEVTSYASAKTEPNLAIVSVRDDRIVRLSELYKPKRTVFATLELMDFVGLAEGAAKEDLFSGSAMGQIRNTDALALVVRNFPDELGGEPSPLEDIRKVNEELILSDLMIVENRLERIAHQYQRGQKTDILQKEEKTLREILEHLNNDQSIRTLELDQEQEKAIRGFQFLTQKPFMVVLNSEETNFGKNGGLLKEIERSFRVLEFAGKFEMELSRLDEDEARLFMEDMGIDASARDRLSRLAYEVLGYISFFTVGSDEVRAWNVRRGQSAVEAAGVIHSDLARGFIRAECFAYDDLMACGSEKGVRESGLLRLEGKHYTVQDGQILNIRFNV